MAFRGRDRGRVRGQGGIQYDKPEPFVIFPEITFAVPKLISKDSDLVVRHYKYENFWRNSPYYLGDGVLKRENESLDIERFSDALKPMNKSNKSGSFYDHLLHRPDNFPRDLLGDTRRERPMKRAKWSLGAGNIDLERRLDELEKIEDKREAEGKDEEGEEGGEEEEGEEGEEEGKEGEKGEKGEKGEEEEDEDDKAEEEEEEEEEESDNGDDDPNPEVDDDEDDYNQEDDGDDEPVY